jgi:hypothetical protein
MYPKMNGVGVLDYASYGPYQIWDADLWACRECGAEVVVGFGHGPVARHDGATEEEGSLASHAKGYKEHTRLIEVKE